MADQPPIIDAKVASEGRLGAPRFAWFDGILESVRGNPPALRQTTDAFNAHRIVRSDLEIEGGKFTILFDNTVLGPTKMTPELRQGVQNYLQRMIGFTPPGAAIESTVRCTEVFTDGVRETLFHAAGLEIRCIDRIRPVTDDDLAHAPAMAASMPAFKLDRRRALIVGGLFLVLFATTAWFGGWVDRVMSPDVEGLSTETGAFGKMLAVKIEKKWGDYAIKIERGESYPATPDDVKKLEEGAGNTAALAAVGAVKNGGAVYVRLESKDGKVLAAQRIELRQLLEDPKRHVDAKLPGRMDAMTLRLALDDGKDD